MQAKEVPTGVQEELSSGEDRCGQAEVHAVPAVAEAALNGKKVVAEGASNAEVPHLCAGKLCIEVSPNSKMAWISEELCIGCGICVKVSISVA